MPESKGLSGARAGPLPPMAICVPLAGAECCWFCTFAGPPWIGVTAADRLGIAHQPSGANGRRAGLARARHPHLHARFVAGALDLVHVLRRGQHVGRRRRLDLSAQRIIHRVLLARRVNRIVRDHRAQLRVDVRRLLRLGRRRNARRRRRWANLDRTCRRGRSLRCVSGMRARRWAAAGAWTRRPSRRSRNRGGTRRTRVRHARVLGGRRRRAHRRRGTRAGRRGGAGHGRGGRRCFGLDGRRRRTGGGPRDRLGRTLGRARRRDAGRCRRWLSRRRRLNRNGDGSDRRNAQRRGRNLVTRLRFEDVLGWLGIGLRRLLRHRARIGRGGRRDDGQLVAIDGLALGFAAAPAARDAAAQSPERAAPGAPRASSPADWSRPGATSARPLSPRRLGRSRSHLARTS